MTGNGPPRYVMIGGFLGSGKTTALDRLGTALARRGLRVGLITNDQSGGLVDTAILQAQGHAVAEIAGGCFCCRFSSLKDAADGLSAVAAPDVFLAEPVGSCTDLVATVSYPLRRLFGEHFRIAPLSVLLDPQRAERILDLEPGRVFSPQVRYVYEKQLEEAEILVVNKTDRLPAERAKRLIAALERRFSGIPIHCVSAKDGTGIEAWLDAILAGQGAVGPTMTLDYDRYADGEAALGWLNATFAVAHDTPFDANRWVMRLVDGLRQRIASASGEIAHVKMTFDPNPAAGGLVVVSAVHSDAAPELRESLLAEPTGGTLVVNARAEAAPETLARHLDDVLAFTAPRTLRIVTEHRDSFRPARPVPTHRVVTDGLESHS